MIKCEVCGHKNRDDKDICSDCKSQLYLSEREIKRLKELAKGHEKLLMAIG